MHLTLLSRAFAPGLAHACRFHTFKWKTKQHVFTLSHFQLENQLTTLDFLHEDMAQVLYLYFVSKNRSLFRHLLICKDCCLSNESCNFRCSCVS